MLSATLLGLIPLAPLLFYAALRNPGRFSPIYVLLVLIFVGTSLKYWLGVGLRITLEEHSLLLNDDVAVLAGFLMMTVAALAFLVGYAVEPRAPPGASRLFQGDMARAFSHLYVPFVVLCVGLLLAFLQQMGIFDDLAAGNLQVRRLAFTEEGERTSFTFLAVGAKWLQVLFLARIAYRQRITPVSLALIVFALFAQFITSDRTSILIFALMFMIVGHFSGLFQKVSARLFRTVTIAIIVLTIVVSSSLRVGIGELSRADFMTNAVAGVEETGRQYSERPYMAGPEKLGLIREATDGRTPFLYGESMIAIVFAPIPRVLWADKPSVRVGQFVGKEVYLRANLSGVPPSLVGELYLNFWWPGIIVGFYLVGRLARRFYARAATTPAANLANALFTAYILIVAFLADLNGGLIQLLLAGIVLVVARARFESRPLASGAAAWPSRPVAMEALNRGGA